MRIERKIGITVAVLASLLLAAGSVVPALASSGPAARFSHAAAPRNLTSTNFAGWDFMGANSVVSEFKVPTLKCTTAASGAGPSSTLVTGSSDGSAAGILAVCSGGSPLLIPTVTVNNQVTNGKQAVHAGDLMKATVVTSATTTTSTLMDLTHKFTLKKSAASAGAPGGETIGDFAVNMGGTQVPVANFGKITFTNAAVGGKAIGGLLALPINMQTKKGVLQILTGNITGANKNSFTTTFEHS